MVKSAHRVFEILELFEGERRSMKVTEIARKLDLPQSSVSMILRTLVERGYMEFDPQGRSYCPSVRVAFLGEWVASVPGEHKPLQDALRELAEHTGEKVVLGRQSGMFVQYVSTVEPAPSIRVAVPPGTLRPLHHCAVGIMLLSQIEDERIGCLLRRYNATCATRAVRANIDRTLRSVESARRLGYYESANLATPGAGVIATLLSTRVRGQCLAVGVAAPTARLHQRRAGLMPAVLAVARQY
ncbi:MAG: IclR family transcriptional regulator [Cupriavidus necator]